MKLPTGLCIAYFCVVHGHLFHMSSYVHIAEGTGIVAEVLPHPQQTSDGTSDGISDGISDSTSDSIKPSQATPDLPTHKKVGPFKI